MLLSVQGGWMFLSNQVIVYMWLAQVQQDHYARVWSGNLKDNEWCREEWTYGLHATTLTEFKEERFSV